MRSIILTAIFILASGAAALGQDKPCDACEGVPYTKDTVMIDRFWDSVYVIVDVRDCNGVQEVKILEIYDPSGAGWLRRPPVHSLSPIRCS